MALNGFSVLLLVLAAPKALAKTKRVIYTAFCLLILRLKRSQNTIQYMVYCDLATTLCFLNKEKKRVDWPEVIGKAKGGGGGQGAILPQWKCHQ